VIACLSDYRRGKALNLPVLEEALRALKSVQSGDPYRFERRTAEALVSYEQVRTLEEVWKTPQLDEALRLINDLLSNAGEGDRGAVAKPVIELFSKLQVRALWHFEQPKQTAPPDVGELCKALKTA